MRLLVAAMWLGALLRAQEPGGAIEGSIRDSVTRQPVVGATVTLSGSSGALTITDAGGAFRFENLQPDTYQLDTKARGYLDSGRGRFAETVRLKGAEATEHVTIDLVPLSDIEGVVLGEEGEPVAGVGIYTGTNLQATSDTEGRYRIESLVPAEYRFALRVPFELRRQTAKQDPLSGDTYGYANTQYYPGAYEESGAMPIPIGPGLHMRRFVLRLRRTRLVSIGGHLIGAAGGGAVSRAEVELASAAGSGLRDDTYQRRPVDQQGGFRFELIRPGSYRLLVYRHGAELPYITPVETGFYGIYDLPVTVPAFTQLNGTVSPSDPDTSWQGSLRVSLYGVSGGYGRPVDVSSGSFTFDNALRGQFSIDNVPPGQYRIQVQGGELRRAGDPQRRLFVARVSFGGQDALAGPITVAENGNPSISITLSGEAGQVSGTVAVDPKEPTPMIVVRRVEEQRDPQQFILPRYADQNGAFVVPDLLPGEYEISAWTPDPRGSTAIDPRLCQDRLAKVKIRAGETAVVRLAICNR